jgi:hypothetical protein|tara:strand:+ start:621 stop:809 length:189 start_codon:yes stop_codon:yes gene_type:complete
MYYKLLKEICFKDNNCVDKDSKLLELERDSEDMIKVETVGEYNIKRVFWVHKNFLKKLEKNK